MRIPIWSLPRLIRSHRLRRAGARLVVGALACLLASCASAVVSGPAASDAEPQTLDSAAALLVAEGASGAQCAVGRYHIDTPDGVSFALVSIGDSVTLTLIGAQPSGPRGAAFASVMAGDPLSVRLTLAPAASGARYLGADGEALFWSRGDRATIELGSYRAVDAVVRPVVFGLPDGDNPQ